MANPDLASGALQKPARGSSIVARQAAKAAAEKAEREFAAAVKARDAYRCRWPEAHKCLGGPLEAAHILDKSLCGPSITANGIALCPWIHRRGPESLHGKELKVEAETPAGADGPISFWRRTDRVDALGQPIYYMVARERAIGILEKD